MARTDNTTDATRGQPLGERVLARRAELEQALDALNAGDGAQRVALETALATVEELITGDLEHPPAAVAQSMNNWLEHNKHLAGGDLREDGDAAGAELTTDERTSRAAELPVDISAMNDGDAAGPSERLARISGDMLGG